MKPDKRSPISFSTEKISLRTTKDKSNEHTKLTEVKVDKNIPSSSHHFPSSNVNKGFDDKPETEESSDINKQECTPLQQEIRDNNESISNIAANRKTFSRIPFKMKPDKRSPISFSTEEISLQTAKDKSNEHTKLTEVKVDKNIPSSSHHFPSSNFNRKTFSRIPFKMKPDKRSPISFSTEEISLQTAKDKSNEHTKLTEVKVDKNISSSSHHFPSSNFNKGFDDKPETEESSDINKQECTPLQQEIRDNNESISNIAAKHNMKHAKYCLCKQGADVKLKNLQGFTFLHDAVPYKNIEICKTLIKKDSDENATDNEKCTPHQRENQSGSEEVTQIRDEGEQIRLLPDKDFGTVEKDDSKIINLEKNKNNKIFEENFKTLKEAEVNSEAAEVISVSDTNYKFLHYAAINGNLEMAENLLKKNAKVDAYDHDHMTPAHRACQFGREDVSELLINRGASIESNDYNYFTPLMWAVVKGQNNIVESLIKKGANVNATDKNIKNILHLAIENNTLSIRLLEIPGCNSLVNLPDKNSKRPLHYAVMKNDFKSVKLLIKNSADILAADNEEKTALHTAAEYGYCECLLELVINNSQNVNVPDNKGRSPLHLAAKKGCLETSAALLENGAKISLYDCKYFTPLDYAAKYGHYKVVLLLIKNGADVNGSDAKYYTPIEHASINGHVKCIKTLLEYGADKKNCFDLAVENYQKEACLTLIENGFIKESFSDYFDKRWEDALKETNQKQNPMEKLIAFVPDIAKIVLDKYEHSETKMCKYLYIEHKKSSITRRKQYFGPSTMIKFNRENLLFHPLTLQLISDKWLRLGLWIHLISLCIYILFLFMVTSLIFIDKAREKFSQYDVLLSITNIAAIIFTVFEICKEVYQVYILGKEYLKDLSNYLELLLYSSTLIYLVSRYFDDYLYDDATKDVKWISATIAVLLAWINLLLYLNRYTFFGIYVTMIIEILKSLINVVLLLFFIVLGFSLSFFMLLGNQNIFRVPGKSIMKTIAMTLGESSFEEIIVDNYISTSTDNIFNSKLPYPEMSLILFTLFLIVCAIVIINLLVGLAVGNIADVRKSALKLMLKSQIDILQASESKCPLWLQEKISRIKLPINSNSWKMRFLNWLVRLNHKCFQIHERELKKDLAKKLELQLIELDKRMYSVKFRMRKNIDLAKEVGNISKI